MPPRAEAAVMRHLAGAEYNCQPERDDGKSDPGDKFFDFHNLEVLEPENIQHRKRNINIAATGLMRFRPPRVC